MASFMTRLKASYDVLTNKASPTAIPTEDRVTSYGPSISRGNIGYNTSKTSVLAPIVARISVDAAQIPMRHVIVDSNDLLMEYRRTELDDRLTKQANIDQTGRAFIQDAVETMLFEGACVLVPVEVSSNPRTGTYDILSLRVGTVRQWFNRSVEVSVYNEKTGDRQEITLPKEFVAIAYNPLYSVMNRTNSTLERLVNRLGILDVADGKILSPSLDLLIQLPYTLKNERRQAEAARRLEVLQEQLEDSKYGIAYLDATERVTQLNRPVTNTLIETVTSLNETLHSQLGLTPSIFAGTASPEEIVMYNNRTILPITRALTEAMLNPFFTRTAISQGHRVMAYPDLFKMAPLSVLADAGDKLTRNEIMTGNEVRAAVGLLPSKDPEADALRNKNLNKTEPGVAPSAEEPVEEDLKEKEEDA